MPRELANPVAKPTPSHVALDLVEIRLSRKPDLSIHAGNFQAGIRLYSTAGQVLEQTLVNVSIDELAPSDRAELDAAIATLERIGLEAADAQGVLPSAESQQDKKPARKSALK